MSTFSHDAPFTLKVLVHLHHQHGRTLSQARLSVWPSSAARDEDGAVGYAGRDAHAHIVFARREYLLDRNVDTEVCP
jgi:hypothetical protein